MNTRNTNQGNESADVLNTKNALTRLKKTLIPFAEGTVIGVLGRWGTFHSEMSYIHHSNPQNTLSLTQIYWRNLQPATLFKLQTEIFIKTGLVQTIGKSASNMGLMRWLDKTYPDLSPIRKSLLLSAICSPIEAIVTGRGEYHKLKAFDKIQNGDATTGKIPSIRTAIKSMFSKETLSKGVMSQFSTCMKSVFPPRFLPFMLATALRSTWSSVVTFCGIYETVALTKPLLPQSIAESSMAKVPGAMAWTFVGQAAIMPVINWQTYVSRNLGMSLGNMVVSFYQNHTLRQIWLGTFGRSINRTLYYGSTFALDGLFSKKPKPASQSSPEQSSSIKKSV